jgi:hypothetical protein
LKLNLDLIFNVSSSKELSGKLYEDFIAQSSAGKDGNWFYPILNSLLELQETISVSFTSLD